METIGFVGVGRMGAGMARRLNDCGYRVTAVYDTRPDVARALATELRSLPCSSLAEVSQAATVVFTVVPDDASMRAIFLSKGDSLLRKAKGRTFVNCGTVSPAIHREVEDAAGAAKAYALEACLAGSIPQARQGTLYIMAAGKRKVFERNRHLLEKLAAALTYLGEAGRAAEVKALVNQVMIANTAALAEGLAIGHALGLDLTQLREVFSKTGAASRVLETDGADMQLREHECFFSAEHAAKDLRIARALAEKKGLRSPVAAAALALYDELIAQGQGGLDKSGVAEVLFHDRAAPPPSSLTPPALAEAHAAAETSPKPKGKAKRKAKEAPAPDAVAEPVATAPASATEPEAPATKPAKSAKPAKKKARAGEPAATAEEAPKAPKKAKKKKA